MSAFVLHVPVRGSLFWIFRCFHPLHPVGTLIGAVGFERGPNPTRRSPAVRHGIDHAYHHALGHALPGRIDAADLTIHISDHPHALLHQCHAQTHGHLGVGVKQVLNEMLVLLGMFVALLTLSLAKFNTRLA